MPPSTLMAACALLAYANTPRRRRARQQHPFSPRVLVRVFHPTDVTKGCADMWVWYAALTVTVVMLTAADGENVHSHVAHEFPPSEIYRAPPRMPSFDGRDKEFRMFRTRIQNGIKEGPNFAG